MSALVFVSATGLSYSGPSRSLVFIDLASGGVYPANEITYLQNMSKGIICCMVRLSLFESMQDSLAT